MYFIRRIALMLVACSIIDNRTLTSSWVSDFTCRCALIFGGEYRWGAVETYLRLADPQRRLYQWQAILDTPVCVRSCLTVYR